MIDLIDLDAPWVPASQPSIMTGDRVRIVLSPECRATFQPFRIPIGRPLRGRLTTMPRYDHVQSANGKTGRIILVGHTTSSHCSGHHFFVEFDEPFEERGHIWAAGLFCRSELDLLTPAPEADACPS